MAAGDATKRKPGKISVGGLIYFAQNIQSENQLKMLSIQHPTACFPLFFRRR